MIGLSRRREKLFDSTPSDKPKSSFKLPFNDLFLTLVIIVSYLLTRMTYEKNNKFGNKIVSFINEKSGLELSELSNGQLFKMNSHSKKIDKKISDIVFLCLLSFFVFKMKWNNIEDTSGINKIAWGSSVVIAPILINAFFENKDKLKIDPDSVSKLEEFKKSNNETKVFLSIALALTFGVGAKLAYRIYTCKGGMTKPMIIQMIIIGTTVGLFLLVNKNKKENFGSSTEDSLGEYFEELFKTKHTNVKYQWKERDNFLKQIKKEDFKTYDEISNGFDSFRLNQFKIDLEIRRKRVNEYFKDQTSADNRFTSNKFETINVQTAYKALKLLSDWPNLWKASEWMYKQMEEWFEQGYWEKYEKEGRPYPGMSIRLYKHFLMNNDGSMVKLSKDTVPSEDIRKKWIFILVMGNLFTFMTSKDVLLNSTEFNTYDKIKGNFKYLYYYTHIFMAYHDNIDYRHPREFLIKKFDPSQPVDEVFNFYKNKLKNPPSTNHQAYKYKTQLPFTQRLVHDIHKKSGIFSNDDYNFKKHKIPSDYTPKIESYKQLMYHANKLHEEFLKKYPTEPTLEDVKKHEKIEPYNDIFKKTFKFSEKEEFIKIQMEIENCAFNEAINVSNEATVIEKESKEKMNKSWVIAFLLILSFTVCKKDTIDYIIEGSLWGYLIQNIARWDDISPNLM